MILIFLKEKVLCTWGCQQKAKDTFKYSRDFATKSAATDFHPRNDQTLCETTTSQLIPAVMRVTMYLTEFQT